MYEKLECSKNNFLIPVASGLSLHSKYDPLKEAEGFASLASENGDFGFAVVLGIGGGYHIASLLQKNSKLKILAVEESGEAISFLEEIPCVKELSKNENVTFCSIENFSDSLKENYHPALDGNLVLLPLRAWKNAFPESEKNARYVFQKTLEEISADFSVQAHFGKIWQKNIFENLATLSSFREDKKSFKIDNKKIAAIISAGPSLDEAIFKLKSDREKYVIFATDTAFTALESYGVKSDFVVSIDGQNISRRHFIKNFSSETSFVFDLCANPSAVKKAVKNGNKIIFVHTGHPLSCLASSLCSSIKKIESGSGTVTIAAVSFASSLGFEKFEYIANDFAYLNGKPYAKGTYLDSINAISSSRLSPSETAFSKIMFRAPLTFATHIKSSSPITPAYTTKILLSYKESLENFVLNREKFSPIINEREFQNFNGKKFVEILENLIEKGENVFLMPLAAATKSVEEAEKLTKKYMKFL